MENYLNAANCNRRYFLNSCRSSGKAVQVKWQDLKVGDIVHLAGNEKIPADILLLSSSDEANICFIDTQNLDGEANNKERQCPLGLKGPAHKFSGTIECDVPTTKIYRFHGTIINKDGSRISISKDNLLLRESGKLSVSLKVVIHFSSESAVC